MLIIEILQTIALCIGSIALVLIAIATLFIYSWLSEAFPQVRIVDEEAMVNMMADSEDETGDLPPKKIGRQHGRRKRW
jgi:hypothetical protein